MDKLERYLALLGQYVSYPTISLPGYESAEAITSCLNFLKNLLTEGGVTVTIWDNFGDVKLNPVIFGSYVKDESLPTVLVYGHYDVVAADGKWNMTEPFKLFKKDGALWGRGSTDNKGQNLIHILTVLEGIEKGTLAYNVKFFIEGNEETGSAGIDKVVEMHKEELKADYILVSDGAMVGRTPVIEASLRGLVNIKVTVTTSQINAHSGLAGGAIYNSTIVAANLISSLYNQHGRVNINNFYKGIAAAIQNTEGVLENNKALLKKVNLKSLFQVNKLKKGQFDLMTMIGLMPTIEVMGITSGEAHKGLKNIIPGQTVFGLNCRLVGDQNPDNIAAMVISHLQSNAPDYVGLNVEVFGKSWPVMLNVDPVVKAKLSDFLTDVYGEKPLDKYVGGGIPVVGHFKDILGIDSLLVPLANEGCNMHDNDENIAIWQVEKALAFSELFFSTSIK